MPLPGTARLAFGRVDESQPVTNAGLEPTRRARCANARRGDHGIVARCVLVSWHHAATIAQPGEMLIVRPRATAFDLMALVPASP